jgi:hypothetical protein
VYLLELLRRRLFWKRENCREKKAHVVEDGGDSGMNVQSVGARGKLHEVGDQGGVEGNAKGYL